MRVLFVHDHVFHRASDGVVYSPGRLPYRVWQRYLEVFAQVEVFARVRTATDTSHLSVSSGPNVTFNFDHGFGGPRHLITRARAVSSALAVSLERVDAVIARLPSELGQLAVRMARKVRRPVATEVVGCAFDAYWNYGSPAARLYAPIMYMRMRAAVRAVPFALYVTRQFLQRRYPPSGDTESVSNVELRCVRSEALANRVLRLSQFSGRAAVGFMGSLHMAYKGLDTALRAIADLRRRGVELELRVLGDGPQEPWRALAARLGVESSVRFDGVLPGGEPVYRWLDDVDVFIQPSRQEGLPRSVIEAMSRACPIIGSTAGGIPELLSPECLHAPGDWRRLAQLLTTMLQNPSMMSELAKRNWQESKAYLADDLNERRRLFWGRFAQHAVRSQL